MPVILSVAGWVSVSFEKRRNHFPALLIGWDRCRHHSPICSVCCSRYRENSTAREGRRPKNLEKVKTFFWRKKTHTHTQGDRYVMLITGGLCAKDCSKMGILCSFLPFCDPTLFPMVKKGNNISVLSGVSGPSEVS